MLYRWLMSLAWLVITAAPALAQTGAQGPTTPPAPKSGSWINVLIAIVLIVGILVASFLNAKRSHQD